MAKEVTEEDIDTKVQEIVKQVTPHAEKLAAQLEDIEQILYAYQTHMGIWFTAMESKQEPALVAEFFLKMYDQQDFLVTASKDLSKIVVAAEKQLQAISKEQDAYFKLMDK